VSKGLIRPLIPKENKWITTRNMERDLWDCERKRDHGVGFSSRTPTLGFVCQCSSTWRYRENGIITQEITVSERVEVMGRVNFNSQSIIAVFVFRFDVQWATLCLLNSIMCTCFHIHKLRWMIVFALHNNNY
jgi:hypothetical protein